MYILYSNPNPRFFGGAWWPAGAGYHPWVDSPLSAEKGLAAMLPIMPHAVGVSRRARHVNRLPGPVRRAVSP